MWASVYQTRERGVKLPRPRDRVHGEVTLEPDGKGDERWLLARCVSNGQDVLRPMIRAQVRRVTGYGMVIKGTEVTPRTGGSKSNVRADPQVWWVYVWTQTGMQRFDHSDDPLEHLAEERESYGGVGRSAGP